VICFAAIAPHGDVDEAPELRAAMEELGRRFDAAAPEAAIVVTPHNVHVEGHFAVVISARVAEHEVDRDLASAVLVALRAEGLPAVAVSYGGNDPGEAEMPLDWGTEVPLAFLHAPRVVVLSPARDRPLAEHVRAGVALRSATEASNRLMLLCLSSGRGGGLEESVEVAGEVALEAADRVAAGLAVVLAALEVGDRGGVVLAAAEQDGVEGAVELAVAAAVESVADGLAGAGRDRGGAGEASEGGLVADPAGVRPGDDQLGGADRADAGLGEQGGCELADELSDRGLELFGLGAGGECAAGAGA
jgi:hypothetical protein